MTVVTPRPSFIHAVVEEKDLHWLRSGMKGKALVAGYPDLKLPATLVQVSAVPQTPGSFLARVSIEAGADSDKLMPGMACSVKFVPHSKKEALVVPSGAVREEDNKYVVHVARKNGKPQTREVTPGRTEGEHTEILSGLQEGEEILLERPGHKASKKGTASEKEEGADQ